MLQVGQIFKKNGQEYCLVDLIFYDNIQYALFLIESDKVDYKFFAIHDDGKGYTLTEINDVELNNILFEIFEEKNDGQD